MLIRKRNFSKFWKLDISVEISFFFQNNFLFKKIATLVQNLWQCTTFFAPFADYSTDVKIK